MLRLALLTAALLVLASPSPAQLESRDIPMLGGRMSAGTAWNGNELMLVGGARRGSRPGYRDVWSWNGSDWSQLSTTISADARWSTFAFDTNRGVLLSCEDQGGFGCNLFEYAQGSTNRIQVPSTAFFATQQRIAYDPAGRRLLMATADNSQPDELWAFDGNTWTQLFRGTTAPGLGTYRLIPEPNGDVLWIGRVWASAMAQMWRFSSGTWTQLPTPPPIPGNASFDVTRNPAAWTPVLLVHDQGSPMEEWHFLAGTWQLIASGGPQVSSFAVGHDGQQTVVVGGISFTTGSRLHGETWTQSGGTWRLARPADPTSTIVQDAAYDELRGVTVVSCRRFDTTETWEWTGDAKVLRNVSPTGSSISRKLEYDAARGIVVAIDLYNGITEEWTGSQWVQIGSTGSGPSQALGDIGFDGAAIIAYDILTTNTWRYDGTAWTLLQPAASPPPTLDVRMASDRRRNRIVMVADQDQAIYEWDGQAWSSPAVGPWGSLRVGQKVVFHYGRGEVLVGSGEDIQSFFPSVVTVPNHGFQSWDGQQFQSLGSLPGAAEAGPLVPRQDGSLLFLHSSSEDQGGARVITQRNAASIRTVRDGCAGTAGVPEIAPAEPWSLPWTGDVTRLRVAPLAPASIGAIFALGASATTFAGGPLPLDLTSAGAPGCSLGTSVGTWTFVPARFGRSDLIVPVPASSALIGQSLFVQAACSDPGLNTLGWSFSNTVRATAGTR